VECGTLYQQAIPGSELVVREPCGHAPHLEKPDEFVRVALDFLSSVPREAGRGREGNDLV